MVLKLKNLNKNKDRFIINIFFMENRKFLYLIYRCLINNIIRKKSIKNNNSVILEAESDYNNLKN